MTEPAEETSLRHRALSLIHPPPPVVAIPPASNADGWPVMGADAYHGLAGDIVSALRGYSEADPVAILISTLVAFGCAAGPNAGMITDGAHHPGRLFACLVGRSAKARKGTSWRNVRNVFAAADPLWTRTRVKSGLSSGEGLIAAVADPTEDTEGNPVPGTGTNDKRLLDLEEEFSRVLQVAKRESSTLSAIVRQAYDTGDLSVLTKTPLTATGAHISILGHITAEELRAKLTDTDVVNGFANRFLFLLVRRSELLPDSPQVDSRTIDDLGVRLQNSLSLAHRIRGQMHRDDAARGLWRVMYASMAADEPPGMLGALVARPEAHTLRLSIAYALLDGTDTITIDHLKAAWAVWSFSRQSCELIWNEIDGDAATKKLYHAIRSAGADGMTLTDQRDLFNRNLRVDQLETMRLLLEADKRIVTRSRDTGGRPAKVSYAVEHDPVDP